MSADSYEKRVRAYEAEGMTRSDAQAVADAEDEQKTTSATEDDRQRLRDMMPK